MSLMERFFPVERRDYNFFDHMVVRMQQQMERELQEMRQRMHQLVPMTPADNQDTFDNDVGAMLLQPSKPIVEEGGHSKLKLEFNVKNFKPQEVIVKIVGSNILQVEANHVEHTEHSHEESRYFRQYQLPAGVDTNTLKPSLTKDGVLTIEATAPPLTQKERLIPIEYKE